MNKTELNLIIKKELRVPLHVRAHCEMVAKVALFLGKKINTNGVKVDLTLLENASLLHDALRYVDFYKWDPTNMPQYVTKQDLKVWDFYREKYQGIYHADAMSDFLRKKGHNSLAKIILTHKFLRILDEQEMPKTLEEKILYYADKRVKHDEFVTLEERFIDGKKRNPHIHPSNLEGGDRAEEKNYELEKELCDLARISLDFNI